MNKFSSSYILLFLLFSTTNIIAQHKNCSTALELCGNSTFHILPDAGIGSVDSDVTNTCIGEEFNSMWVKWTVKESGDLTFIILPDTVIQDIDFLVFEAVDDPDCEHKIPIRCMAAGANTNEPPQNWADCTGATGLALSETDLEESAGCAANSNNFLAPINAVAGYEYIMLINEFSMSGYGYTLSFGGTAVLECITSSLDPGESKQPFDFEVYPTVSTGTIFISTVSDVLTNTQLTIFNMAGQIVFADDALIGKAHQVDLPKLPQGMYFAQLRTNNSAVTKRFVLTN